MERMKGVSSDVGAMQSVRSSAVQLVESDMRASILCPHVALSLFHTYLAACARLIRNVVSKGTGRPVEPLAAPLFHAVPAISRCAQVYFFV